MEPSHKVNVRVLELSQVAPTLGSSSVTEASLPLTYFDLPLLVRAPPELLLFYKLPNIEITHFMDTILPQIKQSLSLTLQHFYPLAGNLIWSPESNQPIIKYIHGDSVTLTVAESNADLDHLSGDHARDANGFQHLVPQLTLHNSNSSDEKSAKAVPLLALQITLFPNSGICLGFTILHAGYDGRAAMMFFKSWASVSRLGNASLLLHDQSLIPFLDRTVIKDINNGFQKVCLQRLVQFIQSKSLCEHDCNNWVLVSRDLTSPPDQVAATFELTGDDLNRLKKWVSSRTTQLHPSRFELACAYVWVCLAKAAKSTSGGDEAISSISFAADCRARLDPPIPSTYFGNCVIFVEVNANREDMVGEDGIVVAVDSIMKEVRGLGDGLIGNLEARLVHMVSNGPRRFDAIVGSTQFGVYKLDFGWGKPKKVEFTTVARTGAIFFAGSRNENDEDGVEISLARAKEEMDAFALSFLNSKE